MSLVNESVRTVQNSSRRLASSAARAGSLISEVACEIIRVAWVMTVSAVLRKSTISEDCEGSVCLLRMSTARRILVIFDGSIHCQLTSKNQSMDVLPYHA